MTDSQVESLVRDSAAPLAAVELPSGRFLAVNPPLAKVLGSTVDELTGLSSLDQLSPGERHSGEMGFQALADGHLTGYQAIRTRDSTEQPDQMFSVWVNALDVGGTRVGMISVTPAADRDGDFPRLPPPTVRGLGDVVLGTLDSAWRIDRISQDVTAFLGITPEQCVGRWSARIQHHPGRGAAAAKGSPVSASAQQATTSFSGRPTEAASGDKSAPGCAHRVPRAAAPRPDHRRYHAARQSGDDARKPGRNGVGLADRYFVQPGWAGSELAA
jgi:hypothetical protein